MHLLIMGTTNQVAIATNLAQQLRTSFEVEILSLFVLHVRMPGTVSVGELTFTETSQRILGADTDIAEVRAPSTDVGICLGLAAAMGKRIFCLYNSNFVDPLLVA
jgi:hypothetical protein